MTGIVNKTGAVSGIIGTTVGTPVSNPTFYQQWYLTSNLSGNGDPVTGWTIDTRAKIGSGTMTDSSGVWSFPETGVYSIWAQMSTHFNDEIVYYEVGISTSINTGGAWANQYGYNSMHNPSTANNYISSQLLYGFDVTNTNKIGLKLSNIASKYNLFF